MINPQTDRPSYGSAHAANVGNAGMKRPRGREIRPLASLLPYVLRRRMDLALAGVFLMLAAAANLAVPVAFRGVIDHGFAAGAEAAVDRAFLGLAGVALLMAVFSASRFYFVSKIGERIVADLRGDVYTHLLSLSPGYFARVSTGEVLSRLNVDAALIESLVGSTASIALRGLITLIGAAFMLVLTDAKLAGLLLLILPAMLVPLLLFGRRVRSLSVSAQDRIADASSTASETIDAIDTVQAFGREEDMQQRFRTAMDRAFQAARRRIGARAQLTAGAISVVFLGVALVLWLGARAVLAGELTAGALAQFVLFAILAASNGAMLSEVWGEVLKASGATERLAQILAEKPEIAAPARPIALPSPGRGHLVFDNVRFAYPNAEERSALQGFSLVVQPGETIALVGPSGAGKSSVFRLLLRFYDPQQGSLRLDGVEARDADPRQWRQRFAYVSQDAHVFSGTAGENLRFGRLDAEDAALEAAAKRAQAWAYLEPRGGLAASLGDRGKALSGGERQRLALARALVRDAPILLLDEATSALDAQNEQLVQAVLNEARKGRTTLIIAHRLATVMGADRIVVMESGRVVEEGNHAALLAKGGLYAKFASMQFMDQPASARLQFGQ